MMNAYYKKIAFCLLGLSLALLACDNRAVSVNKQWKECKDKKIGFQKVRAFTLPLDSVTSPTIKRLGFVANQNALVLENDYDNSLYVYSLDSLKLIQKVKLDREGANGVGQLAGFYYVNKDSIFVYNEWQFDLFLVNSNGVVVSKKENLLEILDEKKKQAEEAYLSSNFDPKKCDILFYGYPNLNTLHPIVRVNDVLVFPLLTPENFGEYDSKSHFVPAVLSLSVYGKEVKHEVDYPDFYKSGNWGGGYLYRHTSIAPFTIGQLLLSFNASHNLKIWNLQNNTAKEVYAGSSMIKKLKSHKNSKPLDNTELVSWGTQQGFYSGVLYDQYRHLIYRLAYTPHQLDSEHYAKYGPLHIIVLSEDGEYLGEWELPDSYKYDPERAFVSKEGLNIKLQNKYIGDEDHLYFHTFVPKR